MINRKFTIDEINYLIDLLNAEYVDAMESGETQDLKFIGNILDELEGNRKTT